MPAPTIQPQRVSFDRDAVSELISYLSFAKALPTPAKVRVAVRRNADDAERASCVARKGRPVASSLVGERMIAKKGVFGIVQGHASRD